MGRTIKNPADLIRKHPLLKEEKSENFWLIVRLFLLSHIVCNEAQALRPAFCNLHQSHWWNISARICWDLISSICVARVVGFPMAGFSIFSIWPAAGVCPPKKRDWIWIWIWIWSFSDLVFNVGLLVEHVKGSNPNMKSKQDSAKWKDVSRRFNINSSGKMSQYDYQLISTQTDI